ncbi:MAG: A/G-specific adenine glycosylase [Pirellulales bacterium]
MMAGWSDESLELLRRRLGAWFRRHARTLPWRGTRDPYRVWISEIMLQQTQVATVIPYYERFVAAFPDAATLAAAPEHEVLRLWEGLGYYRRARNLHAAARVIVERHGGQFPRQIDDVRRLPGIGRYTAGAILSIALDQPHPIVEANTRRLYCRLLACAADPTSAAVEQACWSLAERLVPARGAGLLNQALMELGSLVCTPRDPACGSCPLASLCPTRIAGRQADIPGPVRKQTYQEVTEAAVVVRRGDQVLVRQCGTGERWAGLWDFPRFPWAATPDGDQQLRVGVRNLTGVDVEPLEELTVIKHGVTRYRITLRCHAARPRRLPRSLPPAVRWVTLVELAELPLHVTGRRIARLLAAATVPSRSLVPRSTRDTRT